MWILFFKATSGLLTCFSLKDCVNGVSYYAGTILLKNLSYIIKYNFFLNLFTHPFTLLLLTHDDLFKAYDQLFGLLSKTLTGSSPISILWCHFHCRILMINMCDTNRYHRISPGVWFVGSVHTHMMRSSDVLFWISPPTLPLSHFISILAWKVLWDATSMYQYNFFIVLMIPANHFMILLSVQRSSD